jgi:hypothetical protein
LEETLKSHQNPDTLVKGLFVTDGLGHGKLLQRKAAVWLYQPIVAYPSYYGNGWRVDQWVAKAK